MARPKLTTEQKDLLLAWIAADYSNALIAKWMENLNWPALDRSAFSYYREKCRPQIEQLRQERHYRALNTGLALKEERVARLAKHADDLEAIKWVPDERGRYWNEKAWRETLDDIAKEMGHRKQGVELTGKDGEPLRFEHVVSKLLPELAADGADKEAREA